MKEKPDTSSLDHSSSKHSSLKQKLPELLKMKAKFAASSMAATILDYVVFGVLTSVFLYDKVISDFIGRICGMLTNFVLHKKFVFELRRSLSTAFFLTMLISLGGVFLGTSIMYFIGDWAVFGGNKYFPKIIGTGVVFFYNFFLKRFAFEKRFT